MLAKHITSRLENDDDDWYDDDVDDGYTADMDW